MDTAHRKAPDPKPSAAPEDTEFGAAGGLAFGVERVLGVHYLTTNAGIARGTELVWQLGTVDLAGSTEVPPRLFVDFFPLAGVSFGLAAGVYSESIELEGPARQIHRTAFILHPRIGYAHGSTGVFALWLRAGVTLEASSASDDKAIQADASTFETAAQALSFEAQAVWSPVEHLGMSIGPYADIVVGGHLRGHDVESATAIGLAAGFVGWL